MVFGRLQQVGQSRCIGYYTSRAVVARYRSKEPENEQAGWRTPDTDTQGLLWSCKSEPGNHRSTLISDPGYLAQK